MAEVSNELILALFPPVGAFARHAAFDRASKGAGSAATCAAHASSADRFSLAKSYF